MSECSNILDQETYDALNIKADIIYKFVMMYSDYIKMPRDYGTGEVINMVEVHTLTIIEEHPGIMASEVALMWNRTKGAVSQTLGKLVKRGLIERKKEEGNDKNIHLYVTEKGKILSQAHRSYDIKELIWSDTELHKSFTDDEIHAFYHIMQKYIALLSK